eukprot:Em0008g921a
MEITVVIEAAMELGYSSMKPEQVEVAVALIEGRDVFAILPTGFGPIILCISLASYTLCSTCSKNACFTHDGGDFLKLSRKVLTLRPFLSGTLFRAYWSIFEYRMAGLTYLSGGYVHFLDVLTSL